MRPNQPDDEQPAGLEPEEQFHADHVSELERKIAELQAALASHSTRESQRRAQERRSPQGGANPRSEQESAELHELRLQMNSLAAQLATTEDQLEKVQGHKRTRSHRSSRGGGKGRTRRRGKKNQWWSTVLPYLDPRKQRGMFVYRALLYTLVLSISVIALIAVIVNLRGDPEEPEDGLNGQDPGNQTPDSQFRVAADTPWNATGIILSTSDAIDVTASGEASYEIGASVSPAGVQAGAGVLQRAGDNKPEQPWMAPDLPAYSLIGKIGETGRPFYIGSRSLLQADTAGELFLAMNEESSGGRSDNLGAWGVTVDVLECCVPAPDRSPLPLSAVASADRTSIDLIWQDGSRTNTGYKVYRVQDNGLGFDVATLGEKMTRAVVSGLDPESEVCVFVRAIDSYGVRMASDQECIDLSAIDSATGSTSTISPSEVPGLMLWLDAAALTGVADEAGVSLWPDQSGNGNDAVQKSTFSQPTYTADAGNGQPAISFDGRDDGLLVEYSDSLRFDGGDMTLLIAYTRDTNSTPNSRLYSKGADRNDQAGFSADGGNDFIVLGIGDGNERIRTRTEYPTGGAIRILTHVIDRTGTGAQYGYIGGEVVGSSDVTLEGGIANDLGLYIGTNTSRSLGWPGDITEILLFDRALPESERKAMESYLSQKWGGSQASP